MKKTRLVLVLMLSSLALTGCVKLNMNLTVNADDTISGTAIFAVNKQLSEMGDGETDSSTPETNDLFEKQPGVEVLPYDDGTFKGAKYVIENVPLSAFKTKDAKDGDLTIERVGDEIVVSGNFDMQNDQQDEPMDEFSQSILNAMMASFDMKLSITLPGNIKETNGSQTGQTVTWNLASDSTNTISARSYSPPPGSLPMGLLVAGGVLLLIAAGLFAMKQLRRKPSPDPQVVEAASSPENI